MRATHDTYEITGIDSDATYANANKSVTSLRSPQPQNYSDAVYSRDFVDVVGCWTFCCAISTSLQEAAAKDSGGSSDASGSLLSSLLWNLLNRRG